MPCRDACTCHLAAYGCVRAFARVRLLVISGLSIHYGFLLTHYTGIPYILVKSSKFMSCETICACFYSQVMWRNLEQTIARFYRDRQISLTRGATISLT